VAYQAWRSTGEISSGDIAENNGSQRMAENGENEMKAVDNGWRAASAKVASSMASKWRRYRRSDWANDISHQPKEGNGSSAGNRS
jgi:hypothetical protein